MATPSRFSRPSLIPRHPNSRSDQTNNLTPKSTRPPRLSQLSTAPNSSSLHLRPRSTTCPSPSHLYHSQSLTHSSTSNNTTPSAIHRRRSGNISSSSTSTSRLSFPRLRRGISGQAPDISSSKTPSPYASSPHLSPNPIWDEDSISRTPAKDKENEWLASLGFDLSLLNHCHQSHDTENQDPNLSTAYHRRGSTAGLTEKTMLRPPVKGVQPMWERSDMAFGEGCCADRFGIDALEEAEPGVQLCEAEVRVLQACSPVLAELHQVQGIKNGYLSSSALDTKIENAHVSDMRQPNVRRSDEGGRVDAWENGGMPSAVRGNEEKQKIPKQQADWGFDGEGENREEFVTPGRIRSSRKSRRASARVSTRELKALFDTQDGVGFEDDEVREGLISWTERTVKEVEATAGGRGTASANVVLTPVRASKQMRDALGSEKIVTPVRRSLRISRRHLETVGVDVAEHNSARLESADYAFLPNRSIKERVSVRMKTPLR